MYLLQTQTASPTPQAIVCQVQPNIASAGGKNSGRFSEEVDSLVEAIKENRFILGKHPLTSTWKRLDALYELGEDWNGYEVSAPNPDAIEQAKRWLQTMYDEVKSKDYQWISPHVTANEDGLVVLEWIKGRKRLSVFTSGKGAWYIKAWGPNIIDDMTDGHVTTPEDRLSVWSWIQE